MGRGKLRVLGVFVRGKNVQLHLKKKRGVLKAEKGKWVEKESGVGTHKSNTQEKGNQEGFFSSRGAWKNRFFRGGQ